MDEDKVLKALEEIKGAVVGKGEGKVEEPDKDKAPEVSASVKGMMDELANTLVSAIQEKNGWTKPEDKANLDNNIKARLLGMHKEPGFKYPSLAELGDLTNDEKIVLFIKAMGVMDKDAQAAEIVKGLSEGVDASGGYLVPEPLAAQVFELLPDLAIMRSLADVVPMTSQTLKLNSLANRPKAYWIGERETKTTTSAAFSQVTLTANDLVCRILLSDQLIADANVNIVQWIVRKFTESIAEAEDKAFFTGSGTGQPKGLAAETLPSIASAATVTFNDVIALMHTVPQSVRSGRAGRTAFVAHGNLIAKLRKLQDTTGQYIWGPGFRRSNGETERLPETIYGYPIYEQNDLNQRNLYFGDFTKYVIGDRQQIVVESTRQTETAWSQNATDVKAVERVDGRTVLTSAFAVLTGV